MDSQKQIQKQKEKGSASMAAVLGIGALMSLFMVNEHRKSQVRQTQVLNVNLTNVAREANESTLAKVRSLLIKDGGGQSVLTVEGNKFKQTAGSGFSVVDGAVTVANPVSIGGEWKGINQSQSLAAVANSPKLTTRVSVDDVMLGGASGVEVAKVLVTAETTAKQGNVEKSVKSRALYDLLALAGPPAPAPVPPAPPALPPPPPAVAAVPRPAPPTPPPAVAAIPRPAPAPAPAVRPRLPAPSPAVATRPTVVVRSSSGGGGGCSSTVTTNGSSGGQVGQNNKVTCGQTSVNGKVVDNGNMPVSITVNGKTTSGIGSVSTGSGSSSSGSRGSTSGGSRGGR